MNHSDQIDQPAAATWDSVAIPMRRLQALVIAVLLLFWSTVVVIVLATFVLTAWGDRGDLHASAAPATRPTPGVASDRPAGVPPAAQAIDRDLVLGDVSDFIYFFRDTDCVNGLLTIWMSKAIVYTETPCDRALAEATVRQLVGQPVRVRLVVRTLLLEALFVGSYRFDVDRVWVQAR